MRSMRRLLPLVLLLLAHPASVQAVTYRWFGASSGNPGADGTTFDVAANWSPLAVPAPGDIARFDFQPFVTSPIHLNATRSIGTLDVSGADITLNNNPRLVPQSILVGGASGAGTLTLASGSMLPAQWTIGSVATGTVHVQSGATVQASSALVGVGARGTLHVDGSGSAWTHTSNVLTLGSSANPGVLSVTNGGLLTTAGLTGNKAEITIDGASSRWFDTGTLITNDGPTISGGAHAETNALGLFNSSSGRGAIVTGAGSQWTIKSWAEVWRPGLGAENGGLLVTKAAVTLDHFGFAESYGAGSRWIAEGPIYVLGSSSLLVGNEGELVSSAQVGLGGASPGTATMMDGASWTYAGLITIGSSSGAAGAIGLQSGSQLEGPPITIANGSVHVDGVGSSWHVSGDQTLESSGPETPYRSQLVVTEGAEVKVDGGISIGYSGQLTVAGGAVLQADQVNLSCYPSGYRLLADTGIIRTNRLNATQNFCQLFQIGTLQLGYAEGLGSGLLSLTAGHELAVKIVAVGYDAPATMTNLGEMYFLEMVVGDRAPSSGLFVTSDWTRVAGDLTVGRLGAGTYFQNLGTTSIGRHLFIATGPGSTGLIKVSAGTLAVGGSAFVGGSRDGAGGSGLLVQTGGTTTIADTLFLFPGDSLRVSGGELSAAVLDVMGASLASRSHITGKIINRGDVACEPDTTRFGRLRLTGDFVQAPEGILHLRVRTPTVHDTLEVSGAMSLAGTLVLAVDPGLIPHPGDRIRLVTAGALVGDFPTVIGLPPASGGAYWDVLIENGALYLAGYGPTFVAVPGATWPGLLALGILLLALAGVLLRRQGHSAEFHR